ncbi:MAG: hypothetical protein R2706_11495 [Acidimicrobiales bacterium]
MTTRITEAKIEADPTLPLIRMTRDFLGTPAQLMAHARPGVVRSLGRPGR